ncbi:MAG: L,D-transpeptidase family protein [Planctomycetota bacterium]
MALISSSMYGGRGNRTRNRIYIISGLLVVGAVVTFIYGYRPFGKSEHEGLLPPAEMDMTSEEISAEIGAMDVGPEPQLEAKPEPPEPKVEVKVEIEPEPEAVVEEIALEEPVRSDGRVGRLIDEAMALIDANPSEIIKARDVLNDALSMPMSAGQQEFVKKQLSWLADKWLFSNSVFPQDSLCDSYRVKSGDQLRTIGRRFKVPYEILQEINNISRPEALQAGQTIKVINGPFNATVYLSTFTMDLYLQNTFVRSFSVGLGKPGMETPTGLWLVRPGGKLIKPPWTDPITGRTYNPDAPDYPLGSRWIGLEGLEGEAKGRTGFAIHGTKKPEEIGTGGSQGCIRMYNGDVILVYSLLMPGFSRVRVVE